ncbi:MULTISPECIES: acyl-CoA dehydrogenase family protein [unclassified Streptomyces]|uniref:acyl-CoA dehydrogenase family protein n=1 Tax=unclassified Streptomyces TaxID=2593676 RepID=UPI00224F4777|nr:MULTISPECIES: acyl-CoA dehydrogenase family protein [unclassified Streptomyces]MCX5141904.1 acyl-CoA/acyl-ACP dehydrogenase [Streptomyces sp. NBC_00338]WRZ66378.1 acyl-CoA/acyl-ACP dehydrogenase [Streptomyces sp. NBC_01257]WSU60372.1 acyl-CoA/acyl-ACP dehydrogenase [Streptomyces sp. NBC_01104]
MATAVHDTERAARWAQLRGTAQELADRFAQRAEEGYDKGEFIGRNIQDLIDSGLTAVNVPRDMGGFEATLEENTRLLRIIAGGCGSTAFTLAIHAVLTGSMRSDLSVAVRERMFGAVRDGAFIVGPFTDEGSGGNWVMPSTVARRTPDGFVLDGVKHFATGFDAATHLVITAGLDDDHLEPPFNLAAFFVEKPEQGIEVVSRWSGFALPMTGSHSLKLDSLHVDADDSVFPDGLTPLFVMARQQWGHYCFAAVFLGLAEQAYELAVRRTRGRSTTAVTDLARLPGIQFAVARMRSSLATMDALLTEYATRHLEPGDDLPAFVADTCVPKYYITNEAEHVVATAFEVIGGSGIREGSRIGQIWRDVKAGPLLPFTNDMAREFIGKATLGISPVETPRWV